MHHRAWDVPERLLAARSCTSSFLSASMVTTSCCTSWPCCPVSRKQWRNQKYCANTSPAARAAQGSMCPHVLRVSITCTPCAPCLRSWIVHIQRLAKAEGPKIQAHRHCTVHIHRLAKPQVCALPQKRKISIPIKLRTVCLSS